MSSETTALLSNSTTYLHTVLEPVKQSKLDLNKAKYIFARIQFMVIDFGKSDESDNLE